MLKLSNILKITVKIDLEVILVDMDEIRLPTFLGQLIDNMANGWTSAMGIICMLLGAIVHRKIEICHLNVVVLDHVVVLNVIKPLLYS